MKRKQPKSRNFEGKEIVIGVIDEGFEIVHEDLKDNIYINPDEISGDGIDNDGNGWKDDVKGDLMAEYELVG